MEKYKFKCTTFVCSMDRIYIPWMEFVVPDSFLVCPEYESLFKRNIILKEGGLNTSCLSHHPTVGVIKHFTQEEMDRNLERGSWKLSSWNDIEYLRGFKFSERSYYLPERWYLESYEKEKYPQLRLIKELLQTGNFRQA